MALNVQWRWAMPQVGDPDKVAAGNRGYFMDGMGAIGEGITKMGENRRADEKQKWLEDTTAEKFAHQVEQDRLAQMNTNRNYMLQRDQFNLNKAKQEADLARQAEQDKWLLEFYNKYFGGLNSSDPRVQELEELRRKYAQNANMSLIGLNPNLM